MKNLKAILISENVERNDNGYNVTVSSPTRRTVYVEQRKVTRAEHYSSLAAKRLTTAVFVVYAHEYHGESLIVVGNRCYRINRIYPISVNDIELSCSDEAVPQYEV